MASFIRHGKKVYICLLPKPAFRNMLIYRLSQLEETMRHTRKNWITRYQRSHSFSSNPPRASFLLAVSSKSRKELSRIMKVSEFALIHVQPSISVDPNYCFSILEIVELGVVIGKGGRDITQANASSHISGYSACCLLSEPRRSVASRL